MAWQRILQLTFSKSKGGFGAVLCVSGQGRTFRSKEFSLAGVLEEAGEIGSIGLAVLFMV